MKEKAFVITTILAAIIAGLYFFIAGLSSYEWTQESGKYLLASFSCFAAAGYAIFEIMSSGMDVESTVGE